MKRFRINPKPFRYDLGSKGEMMAWDHLTRLGYKILERNYRCPIGEIDLVARKGGCLVFVEIKTRSSHRFGTPEEAVTRAKQKKLIRLSEWYLKDKDLPSERLRFDVLAITAPSDSAPQFRLIENAFCADDV